MYVKYKVNISKNQVDTLKDAIRKGVNLCFPKGGIRADHVLLLTPALPLAARVLPTIMSGFATGLLSCSVYKAISGSGAAVGDGLYLHKHGKCYRVQKMKGNGLYLAPHPTFVEGVELFL